MRRSDREAVLTIGAVALCLGGPFFIGCSRCKPTKPGTRKPPVVKGDASRPSSGPAWRSRQCYGNHLNPSGHDYGQEELDWLDCRCKRGEGRCCVELAGFVSGVPTRIGGLDPWKSSDILRSLEKRYLKKACKVGNGGGCVHHLFVVDKDRTPEYKNALQRAENECTANWAYACGAVGSHYGMVSRSEEDKARARQYSRKGCLLGYTSACDLFADHLARTKKESLQYERLECELGNRWGNRDANACFSWATSIFHNRYPRVGPSDVISHPAYQRVAFDALVIKCSALFYNPKFVDKDCPEVWKLCQDSSFKSRNKAEWCPKVAEARRDYLEAKRKGTKWPPARVKTEYKIPSCARARKYQSEKGGR